MSLTDPTTWRNISASGIPYRVIQQTGSFSDEEASVTWSALIESVNLSAFVIELFPPPLVIGNRVIPQSAQLPGFTNLRAKKLSFKSHEGDKPIDPFLADPLAPIGTYGGTVRVDVEFGQSLKQGTEDPNTFLEISSNASGEFLHTTGPNMKWVRQSGTGDANAANTGADDDTGEPDPGAAGSDQPEEENIDPTVPVIITVPTVEWTVKWTQIPSDVFQSIIVHRLRVLLGKVNSSPYAVLFSAPAETLLFSGYSYTQQYSWRDDTFGSPPIKLEMKFVEKRVFWRGVICGHNHVWRPGKGWEVLLIDGINRTYGAWDFNLLHKI